LKQIKKLNILNNQYKINNIATQTIDIEGNAILNLKKYINDDFIKSVEIILKTKGRVIVSGIGKSAIIANKIVATLNSTGTPAIFMHSADAIHGDLGMIQEEDIIICISKSGNTPEIIALVPLIKRRNNKLIAIVGNTNSYLAKQADYILNTTVEKEACPNNLAPTSSSTAQLVMGDALAVSLLKMKGFTSTDFAKYHPGGALGKQLYLKVSDIYINNQTPVVNINDPIKKVIIEISSKRLGATAVIDNNNLVGIITDGDIRRMLEKDLEKISELKAKYIMNINPKKIEKDILAFDAFEIMKTNNINQLVVNEGDKYLGIIHIHDMIKEGII
jgi:arabinose-5-phosphate isomerase